MSRYAVLPPGDHDPIVGPTGMVLRPIRASDIPTLFRWRHDPEVIQWWDEPPASEAELAEEELEPDVNPCWRFIRDRPRSALTVRVRARVAGRRATAGRFRA